jgi:hypothetical protein
MLGVMPMEWYVNLVTIAGAGALGWIVLEFLGKPVRAFFDLRDQVRAQLLLLANVAPPKPRETISSSLEIQQYDVALKARREAQRRLRDLGSQMLAFSENEIAACNGIALFGFDAVAAGRDLIALSNTYDRYWAGRADFRNKIEKALRFKARTGSARREMVEHIAARLNLHIRTAIPARYKRAPIHLRKRLAKAFGSSWRIFKTGGLAPRLRDGREKNFYVLENETAGRHLSP